MYVYNPTMYTTDEIWELQQGNNKKKLSDTLWWIKINEKYIKKFYKHPTRDNTCIEKNKHLYNKFK